MLMSRNCLQMMMLIMIIDSTIVSMRGFNRSADTFLSAAALMGLLTQQLFLEQCIATTAFWLPLIGFMLFNPDFQAIQYILHLLEFGSLQDAEHVFNGSVLGRFAVFFLGECLDIEGWVLVGLLMAFLILFDLH